MSSSCGPSSTTLPPDTTAILSASRIVDRRWAITTVVRRFERSRLSSAACTTRSDDASSADVASSSTRIGGSRRMARAIAIRCFCPPDSCCPFSPTCVSYPAGKSDTKPAFAIAAAASTSSCVAPSRPRPMFHPIEPANSTGSCDTSPICERSHERRSERTSAPSSRTQPESTS
mmetsp:Transcript_30535/g.52253  ORF Transcript_30535/g.52253 Transcript_30535/m.52253 type:complete len:174 (+) Transcript_30535:301-822(+)